MNMRSISPISAIAQELRVLPQMDKGEVFCPMCEAWHENNSWCQAPSMTMEG